MSRRWSSAGVLPALAGLLVALATSGCGGGESPTAPSGPSCRQWMLDVVSDEGFRWKCTAGGPSPRCSAFPANQHTTWTYASVEDFVREADVPSRLLVQREDTVGCGTFAYMPCSYASIEYAYDGQGRLLRRERLGGHDRDDLSLSDVTSYTAWDARGRPIAGEIEADGRRETIGISYDDDARLMEATNGELVQQDRYGNTVREAVKWGLGEGGPSASSYTIESLQEVCAP